MCTKTCKNCGWEFPGSFVGRKCNICGAPFDMATCIKCGDTKPSKEFFNNSNICMTCWLKYKKDYWDKHLQQLDKRFADWLVKVRSVPKNYPTLTEEQWLEACRHFNGCARCNSSVVDTRGFFVGSELGGKYADWNIIPLCERCANSWNLSKSVFRYTEKRMYNNKKPEYRDCLENIMKYLGGKLDDAINRGETD